MTEALTLVGPLKVRVSADGVAAFNRGWPCSTLRPSRAYWFEFDRRGDLVDSDVPDHDDGPAAAAMAADCLAWLANGITPDWVPAWTYDDGFSDGASHGETFADAIRAALDERAGPAENQLAAIRAALEAYESDHG